MNIYG